MSTELPRAPASAFIEIATGAPNDTCVSRPHVDVIKEALKAKAQDAKASDEQREQAARMLEQFYTLPADPKRMN